jgi:hypothetical protein
VTHTNTVCTRNCSGVTKTASVQLPELSASLQIIRMLLIFCPDNQTKEIHGLEGKVKESEINKLNC